MARFISPVFDAWSHDSLSELFAAVLRVAVFVALALIFWSDEVARSQHLALVSLAGLGLAAAINFALAILRYSRWWLPWVFATFDVGLFLHCVFRATRTHGTAFDSLLAAPGIWLFAVYLAIAAVRHQPSLIAYYSVLLLTGLLFVYVIAPGVAGSVTGTGDIMSYPSEQTSWSVQIVTAGAFAVSLIFVAWRLKVSVARSTAEQHARRQLSRHFASKVVDRLLTLPSHSNALQQHMAAVMFVDMCGFTSLAETTPSRQLVDLIVEFRARVARIVDSNGGLIEKFMGDGMLIVFGAVEPGSDDARSAVRCALGIRRDLHEWRTTLQPRGLPTVGIGIGLHYGMVHCGVIGSGERVEFTVVGDTVNVAARAQQKANVLGGWSVLSESVLAAAKIDASSLQGQWLAAERLRGKSREVRLYGIPPGPTNAESISPP
jgi:adenylate cyclase